MEATEPVPPQAQGGAALGTTRGACCSRCREAAVKTQTLKCGRLCTFRRKRGLHPSHLLLISSQKKCNAEAQAPPNPQESVCRLPHSHSKPSPPDLVVCVLSLLCTPPRPRILMGGGGGDGPADPPAGYSHGVWPRVGRPHRDQGRWPGRISSAKTGEEVLASVNPGLDFLACRMQR